MLNKEKTKAESALIIAKAIPRKTIYVPRGLSGEFLNDNYQIRNSRNAHKKKLDHQKVLEFMETESDVNKVAKHFRVTHQSIRYIKKKYETLNK